MLAGNQTAIHREKVCGGFNWWITTILGTDAKLGPEKKIVHCNHN